MASSPSSDRIGVFGRDDIPPLISDSERRNLLQRLFRAQDDKILTYLRERLILGHLQLAYTLTDRCILMTKRFGSREEILAEAIYGLVLAVHRIDSKDPVKVKAYLQQSIFGHLKKGYHVRNEIGFKASTDEAVSKLRRVIAASEEPLDRISTATLSSKTGFTQHRVTRLRGLLHSAVRLDAKEIRHVNAEDTGCLPSENEINPSDISEGVIQRLADPASFAALKIDTMEVLGAFFSLSPIERKVMTLYFGIDLAASATLTDIGRVLNISRQRVQQIYTGAVQKVRKNLLTTYERSEGREKTLAKGLLNYVISREAD